MSVHFPPFFLSLLDHLEGHRGFVQNYSNCQSTDLSQISIERKQA